MEAGITANEDWAASLPNADVVVSCLASRSGAPADAKLVEYEANRRLLAYAEGAAFCAGISDLCADARLAFQREKLKFEALLDESSVPATIIATAFFAHWWGKSSGCRKTFLVVQQRQHACKPVSDRDLARFIVSAGVATIEYRGAAHRWSGPRSPTGSGAIAVRNTGPLFAPLHCRRDV